MATQVRQEQKMTIREALGQALVRKCKRLHGLNCELAEMQCAGVTAPELYLLEAEGFMLDFDGLHVIDTVQRSNVPAEVMT